MFPLASATEDPYSDILFFYKGLAQTIENVTRQPELHIMLCQGSGLIPSQW
jgi:hypothetical protein